MGAIKLKHTSGNGTILNSPAANPSSDITLKLPSTTGSAGQVLKVASANHSSTNAELEFGAVTDNNTWVKLSSTTISSDVSDVTFTNSITGAFDTYKMYAIIFTQLQPTSDGVELRMRIQEGGSTITSNNYRARVFSSDGNISNNLNKDHFRLNKDALGNATSGSAVLEDTNGIIYMTNFVANREWRYYGFHMFGNNSQDRNFDNFGGGFASTNATTGIVIFPESGSWASGTLALYGIAQ